MAALRLYAHAITLGLWALTTSALHLQAVPEVVALMLASLAAASFVAERERARRRREPR
jgi:hypothetical protein